MVNVVRATYYYRDGTFSETYDSTKTLHREDGPAIEWDYGPKQWWVDGGLHRLDGPAVERRDGAVSWWFIHNKRLSEEEFNQHPLTLEHRFQKALEEELLND